ncbi:hypothetical protein [Winogradskya humida]|uniref:MmyB-like transcription regulator ligand binding domain-containing protein n=1 Tax=Winogradskya humida TaxID=113566 RepID=A0ABQ4A219_9ACTN|nr:hypothetical protein [Actinoplanes humidus]GIE24900.1 hypothetical protein Ahu01nite_080020 [Actinoplanes humidus]
MRLALARSPENERVIELITTIIRANPEARRLWHIPDSQVSAAIPKRSMNLPHHKGITPIEIVAFDVLAPPHGRMAILVPSPSHPSSAATA